MAGGWGGRGSEMESGEPSGRRNGRASDQGSALGSFQGQHATAHRSAQEAAGCAEDAETCGHGLRRQLTVAHAAAADGDAGEGIGHGGAGGNEDEPHEEARDAEHAARADAEVTHDKRQLAPRRATARGARKRCGGVRRGEEG